MGPRRRQRRRRDEDGLYVWDDHFYPEIADTETRAVLPEGEKGGLGFTSLAKEAMPIIPYRRRDLTRLCAMWDQTRR
jgi:phenylacetate-CoA ligase